MQAASTKWGFQYIGRVDCELIVHKLNNTTEKEWEEDRYRQIAFSNVHSETQSIVLIFCQGSWPNIKISRRAGWSRFGDDALAIMQEILFAHYPPGGIVIRAVLARLPAGAKIGCHIDADPSFAASHRIHVPLQTNSRVEFKVGGDRVVTQVGLAFELNNAMPHMVFNHGETDRVHLIFDYMAMPNKLTDASASSR